MAEITLDASTKAPASVPPAPQPATEVNVRLWQIRFTLAELVYALAWSTLAIGLERSAGQGAEIFVLFILLIGIAVPTMLGSSLPPAVRAGTLPVALMVVGLY